MANDQVKCAIMQPTYLSWIGYFDLIDQVDKFVFLDTVQVQRRSWDVRNRIKTAQGELYLTIPLKKLKSRDETIYYEAVIDSTQAWQKQHLQGIYLAYKRAAFFEPVYPVIEELLRSREEILGKFTSTIITSLAKNLGIKTEFFWASDLPNDRARKDKLLVNICKAVGGDIYVSPPASAEYIERDSPGGEFNKQRIKLHYRQYEHPVYRQLWGEFMPYLSIVDLLFNHGWEESLAIIRSGRED